MSDVRYYTMNQTRPIADPDFIADFYLDLDTLRREGKKDFFVFSSSHPKYFSLGGDLKFFAKCVRRKDTDSLLRYGYRCITIMDNIYNKKAITVAYVHGDAYGGGFEILTPFDYVIAHKDAKFCLPEVKLGMFPGMGIYTFLSRKIGTERAHEIITSGRVYSAMELHFYGVINKVVDKFSEDDFRIIRYPLLAKKNVFQSMTGEVWKELCRGIDLWIECVMNLSEEQLRKIDRVVAMQDKKFG